MCFVLFKHALFVRSSDMVHNIRCLHVVTNERYLLFSTFPLFMKSLPKYVSPFNYRLLSSPREIVKVVCRTQIYHMRYW